MVAIYPEESYKCILTDLGKHVLATGLPPEGGEAEAGGGWGGRSCASCQSDDTAFTVSAQMLVPASLRQGTVTLRSGLNSKTQRPCTLRLAEHCCMPAFPLPNKETPQSLQLPPVRWAFLATGKRVCLPSDGLWSTAAQKRTRRQIGPAVLQSPILLSLPSHGNIEHLAP